MTSAKSLDLYHRLIENGLAPDDFDLTEDVETDSIEIRTWNSENVTRLGGWFSDETIDAEAIVIWVTRIAKQVET